MRGVPCSRAVNSCVHVLYNVYLSLVRSSVRPELIIAV